MVADTTLGLPPVVKLATQHAANAVHKAGYLMIGGVQSITIPLTAQVIAWLGLVAL